MVRLFFSVFVLVLFAANRMYVRSYHENGQLAAAGWKLNGQKDEFWKYYYSNGNLMEQGHYKMDSRNGYWYFYGEDGRLEMEGHMRNGQKNDWWLFYDMNEKINHKCQLREGIKNGYCLKYMDEKLKSAEKYRNGQKVKEWFSFRNFKKENKLSDLK